MPGASALAAQAWVIIIETVPGMPASGHACNLSMHAWPIAGRQIGLSLEGCTTLWLTPLTNRPLVDSRSMGMCALRASV